MSYTDTSQNYCYRHPDRQSFVLCQRCGRTICPQCQVQAAVGVHCVECARADRNEQQYSRPPRLVRAARATVRSSTAPVVTYALIGVTVLIFLLQFVPGVTNALLYAPVYTQSGSGFPFEPWRMLTYAFVHTPFTISNPFSILHILLNMYSLFIFGRVLEPIIGRWRFGVLYGLSAIGGAVAVDYLSGPLTPVIGASGAIFGLMAATFMVARKMGGGGMQQLIVLVVLNLAIGFFVPGIAWQAHVGGLLFGALIGLIMMETRQRRQQTMQYLLLVGVALLIVVLTVFKA